MVDVFDEVEEELRQERYQAWLRKYGPWVLGGVLLIVVGVAGYQGWNAWRDNVAASASDEFINAQTALEEGDLVAAAAGFDALAQNGPRGYASLALMQQAAVALERGDMLEAARLYESAAERAPDRLTRDIARYKGVLAAWDELSYDDVVLRLDPLTENDAALGLLARELMGAAALRVERWADARGHYEFVQFAIGAPQGAQRRAAEALAYINAEAPAAPAPEETQP